MDEAQRQKLKKQLDGIDIPLDSFAPDHRDLSNLYKLVQQALDNPERNTEQIIENISAAAQSLQESLPDLSGLADAEASAQVLLDFAGELIGELLSGLASG